MTPADRDRLRAFIAAAHWIDAKTYRRRAPHEYCNRLQMPREDWTEFWWVVELIRTHGYARRFWQRTYQTLHVEAHYYWTMGAPTAQTFILNRALIDHYHSALAEPVHSTAAQQWTEHGSVALVHDLLTGPLPPVFQSCDVWYADLPWQQGFPVFNQRAGIQDRRTYAEFLAAIRRLLAGPRPPCVLVTGQHAARHLPPATATQPVQLNGASAVAYLYDPFDGAQACPEPGRRDRLPPLVGAVTTEDLLQQLARTYQRVGDFCCGYGRAGRHFVAHGKTFVMSDYDPNCIGYIAQYAPGWQSSGPAHENLSTAKRA